MGARSWNPFMSHVPAFLDFSFVSSVRFQFLFAFQIFSSGSSTLILEGGVMWEKRVKIPFQLPSLCLINWFVGSSLRDPVLVFFVDWLVSCGKGVWMIDCLRVFLNFSELCFAVNVLLLIIPTFKIMDLIFWFSLVRKLPLSVQVLEVWVSWYGKVLEIKTVIITKIDWLIFYEAEWKFT